MWPLCCTCQLDLRASSESLKAHRAKGAQRTIYSLFRAELDLSTLGFCHIFSDHKHRGNMQRAKGRPGAVYAISGAMHWLYTLV
jgi:hypothetical protein